MKIKPANNKPTFGTREEAINHCRIGYNTKTQAIDVELELYKDFKDEDFYKELERHKSLILKALDKLKPLS